MVVATEVASDVGRLLRARWGGTAQVSYKSPVNLVTDADHDAEALALRMLRGAFPDDAIVAEESQPYPASGAYCWYVDPLDGTTNFAHHYPHFAVSIALTHHDELVGGVVNDPLRQELFVARRGAGATLNGTPIRVSSTPVLDQGLLATGFPYDRRERAPFYLRFYERFLTRSQGIRRGGSAALDLCYVACGHLDGFWEWHLQPWDTAAGILIVEEAGGMISDFRGHPFRLGGHAILASNGHLHPEMTAVLGELLEEHDV
jgi:myo-inositol-1(or 4)-monophosphatase